MRAGETEGGVPLLCLLAQQFHTLSAVKFSRTNTFAQKTLVLINCHFPATQIPIHWKHSGGTARTATGLGVLMSKGKINLGSGRINNQFSHAWGAKLKAFDVKKHLNNQMLIFIALENSILRVGTELGGAKRGDTYFFFVGRQWLHLPAHPKNSAEAGGRSLRMCQFFSLRWLCAHCNYGRRKTAVLWIKLAAAQHSLKKQPYLGEPFLFLSGPGQAL